MAPSWDMGCAARTWWQECRNEPEDGQRAVAHAIVNRKKTGRWGSTLAEVCFSEWHGIHQFSGWNRTDKNRIPALQLADDDPLLLKGAAMIQAALDGEADPTGGATHYYNPDVVDEPVWVRGDPSVGTPPAIPCGKFGHQLFFKGVR